MQTITLNKNNSVKHRFKTLDVSNLNAIVSAARKGIKTKVFYDFAGIIKMPEKNLVSILNLFSSTISNHYQAEKVLQPIYSEHLMKLIGLYEKGEEIFGNIDEFNYWLRKPFWNKKTVPLDLVATAGGVDLINQELDKLAQGYPV